MISSPANRRQRASFTLVELLVAMALTIFIMVILTEAFTTGMNGFRQLKAIGDMNERLRACTITLRGDLIQLHFDGTKRPSDSNITTPYVASTGSTSCQPLQGYLRIEQEQSLLVPPAPGFANEGYDGDGIPSFRGNSKLFFTVSRTGITRDDYFAARLRPVQNAQNYPAFPAAPGEALLSQLGPIDYRTNGTVISRWAEVGYFLVPTGDDANGTTLFALVRRVRVLVSPDDTTQTDPTNPNSLNWSAATAANPGNRIPSTLYPLYSDVSCEIDPANPSFLYFNSPDNLSGATTNVPPVRGFFPTVGAAPSPTGALGNTISPQPLGFIPPAGVVQESVREVTGDDILLSDVISFTVRVLPQVALVAGGPTPFAPQFQPLNGGAIYDTNYPGVVGAVTTYGPPPYRLRALEITIRIWDVKSQQSRQVTVIQDM
jgi:type II secretory pathway pseudopilin PulG